MDEKTTTPTPEELNAEAEALKESKEEEIRAEVIAEFELDETNDADKIEKMVKKEMGHREKLSGAIGQKIKYRDLAKGAIPPKKEETPAPKATIDSEEIDNRVKKGVNATLEQRDLDDMDTTPEIKAEIKRVAEIRNITVKQARRDPYIVSLEGEQGKANKSDDASISRKANKSGGKKSWNIDTPPEVDMSTEAGRKEYDEWKTWAIGQGA